MSIEVKLAPFPAEFPEKGRFPVWDKAWNPKGYSDEPQYPGQQPNRFPINATTLECFLGGYIVRDAQ